MITSEIIQRTEDITVFGAHLNEKLYWERAMASDLNTRFAGWLQQMADEWDVDVSSVVRHIGADESADRHTKYPSLAQAVSLRPIDPDKFNSAAKECWAIGGQYDLIKLRDLAKSPECSTLLANLLDGFPANDDGASQRIDEFIEATAVIFTVPTTGASQAAIAALIISAVLSAVFPKRFVDFRQTRWKKLAEDLGYGFPSGTYGERIIAAGRFARAIAATETFQQHWPTGEPLWVIAGICWHTQSKYGSEGPPNADTIAENAGFPEGTLKTRLHIVRERNSTVVKAAKALWQSNDPLLTCDVCAFSFFERYGKIGYGFIEAHHIIPLSELRAGTVTRIEDLAKVCANCHRMIHASNRSIAELRDSLQTTG